MNTFLILLIILCVFCIVFAAIMWQKWNNANTIAKLYRDNEERFSMLANEIFDRNARIFKADSEQRLSEILSPVKNDLDEFRHTFQESYSKESRERFSLQERMRELVDSSMAVGREARNLANALRGNTRVQGRWGEMILENILRNSGLREGEEYVLQKTVGTVGNGNGNLRPDAVINYPDERTVVVDAKTSLTAYFDYVDASEQGNAEAAASAAKAHVASVKAHIAELRTKAYQDLMGGNKTEFVVMFIPHEGAFLAAMHMDKTLWDNAYQSRIVIASPTHLLSVLKLVEQMWLNDRRTRNSIAIAEEGSKMLDKLSAFLSDLDRIDASLRTAHGAYEAAITKLKGRGGVVSHAEKMQALGVKTSRPLPHKSEDIEK